MLIWRNVAHTATNLETRNIHSDFINKGWLGYWIEKIQPVIDWYADRVGELPRVLLHNPFGALKRFQFHAGENAMDFLQYLKALQKPALKNLCESFVDDFHRIKEQFAGEIICYFGSPQRSQELRSEFINGRIDNVLHKTWRALRPFHECGLSTGWDAFSNVEKYGPIIGGFSAATFEQSRALSQVSNASQYIESTPEFVDGQPNGQWGENMMIMRSLFQNRHSENQHGGAVGRFPRYVDSDFYTGEVIQLIKFNGPPNNDDSVLAISGTFEQNCTPALEFANFDKLRSTNYPIETLLP